MRDESIDRAKGMLIFLVVLGHVVGMVRYVVGGAAFDFLNQLYTAVYLFHVPAFFFLAGVVNSFAVRGEKREGLGRFVLKRARRLVVPYFVWGAGSVLAFLALRGVAGLVTQNPAYRGLVLDGPWWQPFLSLLHAGGWPKGQGFVCNGVLWFLPVMFVVSVADEGLRGLKGLGGVGGLMGLALGCFLLGGVIQLQGPRGLPWGLSVAPYYLGYVLAGEIAGAFCCDATGVSRPRWAGVGCVLGWGVYLGLAWSWPDLGLRTRTCGWYAFGLAMALVGAHLSLATARRLPRVSLLAAFGRASLAIMLAHKFLVLPVQAVLQKAGPLGEGLWVGVVALAGSVAVAFGIAMACWWGWTLWRKL